MKLNQYASRISISTVIAVVSVLSGCQMLAPTKTTRKMEAPPPFAGMPQDTSGGTKNPAGMPNSGQGKVEYTDPTNAPDSAVMEKVVGKWTGLLKLPMGAGNAVTARLNQEEVILKKVGPISLEITPDSRFTLTYLGVEYKGTLERTNRYLDATIETIGGKAFERAKAEGVTNKAGAKLTLPEDMTNELSIRIDDNFAALEWDRGQGQTLLYFDHKG
ncbi:MAG: hypothetical protein JST40_02820 [Armatimonadetes bacterium]|nr:hypothetical protein [Armatimonadota bacterium]